MRESLRTTAQVPRLDLIRQRKANERNVRMIQVFSRDNLQQRWSGLPKRQSDHGTSQEIFEWMVVIQKEVQKQQLEGMSETREATTNTAYPDVESGAGFTPPKQVIADEQHIPKASDATDNLTLEVPTIFISPVPERKTAPSQADFVTIGHLKDSIDRYLLEQYQIGPPRAISTAATKLEYPKLVRSSTMPNRKSTTGRQDDNASPEKYSWEASTDVDSQVIEDFRCKVPPVPRDSGASLWSKAFVRRKSVASR